MFNLVPDIIAEYWQGEQKQEDKKVRMMNFKSSVKKNHGHLSVKSLTFKIVVSS